MNAIQQTVRIDPGRRALWLDEPLPESVGTGRLDVVLVFPTAENHDAAESDEADATGFIKSNPAYHEHLLRVMDDIKHGRNMVTFNSLEDAIASAERKPA